MEPNWETPEKCKTFYLNKNNQIISAVFVSLVLLITKLMVHQLGFLYCYGQWRPGRPVFKDIFFMAIPNLSSKGEQILTLHRLLQSGWALTKSPYVQNIPRIKLSDIMLAMTIEDEFKYNPTLCHLIPNLKSFQGDNYTPPTQNILGHAFPKLLIFFFFLNSPLLIVSMGM